MAQLTHNGTSTAPTGVITVADLLTRYAPDPMVEPEPTTAPVSVESLLRREGRSRADIAALHVEDPEDAEPRRSGGQIARRGAVAAGVLVAAGSVFGAVVVNNTASTEFEAPRAAGGDHPGAGRLDQQQPATVGAIPVVVDTASQTDTIDPGDAAPTSWMRTAFPGSTSGSAAPAADADPAPAPPAPSAGQGQAPAGQTPTGPGEAPGSAQPQGPSGDSNGPVDGNGTDRDASGDENRAFSAPADDDTRDDTPDDNDGSGPDSTDDDPAPERSNGVVGGAVENLGGALPEPLGSPVESLGKAVGRLI